MYQLHIITTFLFFDNRVIQEQTTLYHASGHEIGHFVYNYCLTAKSVVSYEYSNGIVPL